MIFLYILTSLLVVVTIIPFRRSHSWWVRGCEFPRQHIAFLASVLLILSWVILSNQLQIIIFTTLLGAVLLYQSSWFCIYTRIKKPTVEAVAPDAALDITCVASNVQMDNDDYSAVKKMISEEKPDVLFLMETNQQWFDALESVLKEYKTVVTELKDNFYGCVFATNLEVDDVNIHYVAGDDTPSVHGVLVDKTGKKFVFRGIHPRPPLPSTTSKKRDHELKMTAKFARDNNFPELVMGDFNDVIWSRNSIRFKKIGKYFDPQVGRASIKSFHAKYWFMRVPIDQFYVTKSAKLISLARGPYVGSDHFPLIAKVRFEE